MVRFWENNIIHATDALTEILSRYQVLLCAPMQSGKTGTFLYAACEALYNGDVDQVLIMSGVLDTSLRAQYRRDIHSYAEAYAEMKHGNNVSEYRKLVNMLKSKIKMPKTSKLKKYDRIPPRTFLIHDECHYAQSKNQNPYKYLEKWGLEDITRGNITPLSENQIYYLSISATPFSEIAANNIYDQKKHVYLASPGENYIGCQKLYDNGKIKFTAVQIKPTNKEQLINIFRKYNQYNKYIIIRTKCATNDQPLMKEIANDAGFRYISIFGDADENAFDCLKNAPDMPTLIHICGKARLGQQLYKKHISMVYEQSANPNTDTTLQGLLGRMCGYDHDVDNLPDIYISKKAKKGVMNYIDWWKGDVEAWVKINNARNLKGGGGNKHTNGDYVKDKSGKLWRKRIPIKIEPSDIEKGFINTVDRNALLNAIEDINGGDKDYILNNWTRNKVSWRNSEKGNYKTRDTENTLEQAVQNGVRCTGPYTNMVTDWPTDKVRCIAICGPRTLPGQGQGQKCWYIIGYEPHDPIDGDIEINMPEVKQICNYNPTVIMEDGEVIENINGGQIIAFPFEVATNPVIFKIELDKAIKRTLLNDTTYIENCLRKISSMSDTKSKTPKGIVFDNTIYTKADINNILKQIEQANNVKIRIEKVRGRSPIGYIRYKSMSW
jgi:hypothetical protein